MTLLLAIGAERTVKNGQLKLSNITSRAVLTNITGTWKLSFYAKRVWQWSLRGQFVSRCMPKLFINALLLAALLLRDRYAIFRTLFSVAAWTGSEHCCHLVHAKASKERAYSCTWGRQGYFAVAALCSGRHTMLHVHCCANKPTS